MHSHKPSQYQPRVAGVYAITPEVKGDWTEDRVLASTQAVLQGGVRWLQCRQKAWEPARLARFLAELNALCTGHGAHLIVNDAPADVLSTGQLGSVCGVHVGRDDMPIAQARMHWGDGMMIGASCYNEFDRAQHAVAAGASYVAFGAMYASNTKPLAVAAPLDLLGRAKVLGVPVVAIGGIGLDKLAALRSAGADAVAVVGALYEGGAGGETSVAAVQQRAALWVKTWQALL